MNRTAADIIIGSRWRALIGDHAGVEVKVLGFNRLTVTCRPQGGNGKNWDRGKSHKNSSHFWRVPVDAFLNRYELLDAPKPEKERSTMPNGSATPIVLPDTTGALTIQQREIVEMFRTGAANITELSRTYHLSVKVLVPMLRANVPEYEERLHQTKLAYDRARQKRNYDKAKQAIAEVAKKGEPEVSRVIVLPDGEHAGAAAIAAEQKVYGSVEKFAHPQKFEVTALIMRPVEVTETVTARTMEEALAAVRAMAGAVEVTAVRLLK